MRAWSFSIAISILAAGCPSSAPVVACLTATDCPTGMVCVIGRCSSPGIDASSDDAGPSDAMAIDAMASDAMASDANAPDSGICRTGSDCAGGGLCCEGGCTDVTSDRLNCGACGRVCGTGSTCTAGACACADADHADCNLDLGSPGGDGCEVDLRSDPANCRTCGSSCTDQHVASGSCVDSTCVIAACSPLFGDCNTSEVDGCETDLSLVSSCGSCTTSCAPMGADALCVVSGTSASCGFGMCMSGTGDCDGNVANGCETSLRATRSCGTCATDCSVQVQNAAASSCSASGTCDYTSCSSRFSDCDTVRANGCESAWTTGRCGATCTDCSSVTANATGRLCSSSGTCDFGACSTGFSNCDANRANGCERAWSVTTCGPACTNCTTLTMNAAGRSCSAGGTCDYGACTPGFSDCDGNRPNGCEASWSTAACGAGCTNCNVTEVNTVSRICLPGGACDYTTCNSGFLDCDGSRANGCETNGATTVTRCGSCGNDCTTRSNISSATCAAGVCQLTCAPGFTNCGVPSNPCVSASPSPC